MSYVPNTRVRTSHALTIKANGVVVGLINGWTQAQSRTITPIYEVSEDDSGNPVENAPGNVTGLTIAVGRFDSYKRRMEEAFGTPDLIMLTRQSQPFEVMEVWASPHAQEDERYIYQKCWFSNLGRTLRSDDNRIVNVSATLVYTKKLKVGGIMGDVLGRLSGTRVGDIAIF